MWIRPTLALALLLATTFAAAAPHKPIWPLSDTPYPLPVVQLVAGTSATVSLKDSIAGAVVTGFEGASGGDGVIRVETSPANPAEIIVTSLAKESSVAVVNLRLKTDRGPRTADLLASARKMPEVTFTYRADAGTTPPQRVFVAGEFNGWNNTKNEMIKSDTGALRATWHHAKGSSSRTLASSDGTFKATLRIAPGEYRYKLVADGNWMADPANPRRDSGGDGNSIITVPGSALPPLESLPLPEYLLPSNTQAGVQVALTTNTQLDESSVVVIANNQRVPAANLSVDKTTGRITWRDSGPAWTNENHVAIYAKDKRGAELLAHYPFINSKAPRAPRDEIIYFAFTDRFRDANPANNRPNTEPGLHPLANYMGGDFAGLLEKIRDGYFTKLGVTTLWISPVNENTYRAEKDALPPHRLFSSYHGYWPTSLTDTNKRLGTMAELKSVVASAQDKGIAVLLDFVANHVHAENPIVKAHPEWITPLQLPDGSKNIRKFNEHSISTWFDTFMPDINYDGSPEARKMMTENALYWLRETNADGFRLDAVKHVSNAFWRDLRVALDTQLSRAQKRKFYTVGETISSRDVINPFIGADLLDGQFDFPLYFSARPVLAQGKGRMSDLADAMRASATQYPAGSTMSPLIGNHDVIRFMAFADDDIPAGLSEEKEKDIGFNSPPTVDKPESYERMKLAMAFLLTQPGAPTIYYGDEIGLGGAHDPDNRRMMPWKWNAEQQATFDTVATLAKARRASTALRRGALVPLFADAERLAFARVALDDVALVVLARKPAAGPWTLPWPESYGPMPKLEKLAARGAEISTKGQTLVVKDSDYAFGIWRVSPAAPGKTPRK